MGLDVFLFKIRSDQTYFDKQTLIDIIARDVIDPSYLNSIEYPDGGGAGEIFGLETDEIDHLMFAHFGGPTFLARMFELADCFDGLLFWTGEPESGFNMGVTKEHLLEHIPDDFKPGGPVAIIKDVEHLNDLMGGYKMTPMTYIECGRG